MSDGVPEETSTKKRRRTELACTTCRQRHQRCDGIRPKCGSCLRRAWDCDFEPPPSSERSNQQDRRDRSVLSRPGIRNGFSISPSITSPGPGQFLAGDQRLNDGESSLRNVSNEFRAVSPAHGRAVNLIDDASVDVLATATFNDTADTDKEYFGPSSNHFLFHCLLKVFVKTAQYFGVRDDVSHDPLSRSPETQMNEAAPVHGDIPRPVGLETNHHGNSTTHTLPSNQDAILLINHYFATVGLVLPYVDKAALVSQYLESNRESPPRFKRPFFALLTIICALSLKSLGNPQAEQYYLRALAVIDQQCVGGSSLELIQALLLLAVYQQDSHRSITSWTTHCLTVKAALQYGLHSPSARKRQSPNNAELMERLWTAIVFNDEMTSQILGRPALIHPRFLPPQHSEGLSQSRYTPHIISVESRGGHAYHSTTVSSSPVIASTVELLYNNNNDILEQRRAQELLQIRNKLVQRLQSWRETILEFGGLIPNSELQALGNGFFDVHRFRVLLSVHYYRLSMLMNWPVIITFLENIVEDQNICYLDLSLSWADFLPVINNDWQAVEELGAVIRSITVAPGFFLHSNAAWFICNYTSLTICLHLFMLLLASKHDKDSRLGFTDTEIKAALNTNLDNLNLLGRTSLMTYKARNCLLKLRIAFDVLLHKTGGGGLPETINNDFLFEQSLNDFLNADPSVYGDDTWF